MNHVDSVGRCVHWWVTGAEPVDCTSHPQIARPHLQPIVEKDFLDRGQVDMRHIPDGQYSYIGHFMDHFSKSHVLFPWQRKTAKEVSRLLEERVLAYFGPPKNFLIS